MGASGSMNYSVPSGSFYSTGEMLLYKKKDPHTALGQARAELTTAPALPSPQYGAQTSGNPFGMATARNSQWFKGPSTTTTITEELTVKYFQRVYDGSASVWCYFTKTTIDADPDASETTPVGSGEGWVVGSHSIIRILEIY